jgi:hypothetical protein
MITESSDPGVVLSAVYNLPCFHALYKDVCMPASLDDNLLANHSEPTVELNFHELYQTFSESESIEIREIVAACIHEPFIIRSDTENISTL